MRARLPASAFERRAQNSRKADESRVFEAHERWIRKLPCAILELGHKGCGEGPLMGRIQACHVDRASLKGMGLKAPSYFLIPMCAQHHMESDGRLKASGVKTFQRKYSVDLYELAQQYAAKSPHKHLWSGR